MNLALAETLARLRVMRDRRRALAEVVRKGAPDSEAVRELAADAAALSRAVRMLEAMVRQCVAPTAGDLEAFRASHAGHQVEETVGTILCRTCIEALTK